MRGATACASIVWVCLFAPVATGSILHEDFDDGVLDPAWTVTFNPDVDSWSYGESGTDLTVTAIDPQTWGTEPRDHPRPAVTLARSVDPVGDFQVYFDLSWDSQDDVQAMQWAEVRLLDGQGGIVASCGYLDAWVLYPGKQYSKIGGSSLATGYPQPGASSAAVELIRTGEDVEILWNGSSIFSGTAHAAVEQVELKFTSFAYSGDLGTAFFGTIAVDRVSMIPEPAALSLLALGSLAIIRRRRAPTARW